MYPKICKNGFILTCKEEEWKTAEFKDLVTEVEIAAQTCNNAFREIIYEKEKMQEKGAIHTMQEKALCMIYSFFKIYTCSI